MGFKINLGKFTKRAFGGVVDTLTGKKAVKDYKKEIKPVMDFFGQYKPVYERYFKELEKTYTNPTIQGVGQVYQSLWDTLENTLKPWTPSGLLASLWNEGLIKVNTTLKALEEQKKQQALQSLLSLSEQAVSNWARSKGTLAEAKFGQNMALTGGLWNLAGIVLGKTLGGGKTNANT